MPTATLACLADVAKLLASPIHEYRFAALEILVAQYERERSQAIFDFYLKHTKVVNNWDLVDTLLLTSLASIF